MSDECAQCEWTKDFKTMFANRTPDILVKMCDNCGYIQVDVKNNRLQVFDEK